VGELLGRLRKLGVADDGRLSLSTVHSFCLTELVLPYAILAGVKIPAPLTVASPAKTNALFQKAYGKTLGGTIPNWFRIECDKLRRTVVDRGSARWKDWPGRETEVVEEYEALLSGSGLIDFDGIILAGLELIEKHEWVRQCIRAKYPIMVIDEYQDLGLPLHRIVSTLMIKAGVRVIAVGDPDQSIYGFTGAKPGLLRRLAAMPSVAAFELKLNYRCADQIIAASKAFLESPIDFKSHDGHDGDLTILKTGQGVKGQAEYALKTIVPALLKKNPEWKPGDIAFLYRSYNQGNLISEAADAMKLRYFRLDNGSPIKRSRLVEWLTNCAKWCSGGWHSGTVSLSQLFKEWRGMRRSLTREIDELAARKKLISTLFSYREGTTPLRVWLNALRESVLEAAFEAETGLADEKDNFVDLLKASESGGRLAAYSVEIFGNHGRSPDLLNFMTLHSAKGLEFQAVIMLGLEEDEFPSTWDNTPARLEEARRLFYVGITRAKSTIYLMYSSNESPFITMIRNATGKS
jgi:ATP-dependent DNA helicase Rep/DNA helicase-2/ATP-dependent DNA helicase PcrA